MPPTWLSGLFRTGFKQKSQVIFLGVGRRIGAKREWILSLHSSETWCQMNVCQHVCPCALMPQVTWGHAFVWNRGNLTHPLSSLTLSSIDTVSSSYLIISEFVCRRQKQDTYNPWLEFTYNLSISPLLTKIDTRISDYQYHVITCHRQVMTLRPSPHEHGYFWNCAFLCTVWPFIHT